MKGISNEELERRKADFCTNRCPHADDPCTSFACEEYKKEFKMGTYSQRKKEGRQK